jgi:hypothetical protein
VVTIASHHAFTATMSPIRHSHCRHLIFLRNTLEKVHFAEGWPGVIIYAAVLRLHFSPLPLAQVYRHNQYIFEAFSALLIEELSVIVIHRILSSEHSIFFSYSSLHIFTYTYLPGSAIIAMLPISTYLLLPQDVIEYRELTYIAVDGICSSYFHIYIHEPPPLF